LSLAGVQNKTSIIGLGFRVSPADALSTSKRGL
jgi:hypothetical protein